MNKPNYINYLPKFPLPKEFVNADTYLKHLVYQGAKKTTIDEMGLTRMGFVGLKTLLHLTLCVVRVWWTISLNLLRANMAQKQLNMRFQ